MFCTKCGNPVGGKDVLCANCNSLILRPEVEKKENLVLAIFALVFSVICPIIGLFLGMIGVAVYKNPKYRNISARAITVSISLFFILCFATILLFSLF